MAGILSHGVGSTGDHHFLLFINNTIIIYQLISVARQQQLAQRLSELEKYPRDLAAILETASKSIAEFPHKQHLPDMATRGLQLLAVIKAQADTIMDRARAEGPSDALKHKLVELMENAKNANAFIGTAFGKF